MGEQGGDEILDKPVIGIACSKIVTKQEPFIGDNKSYISIDYIHAIEKAGGIPIQLPITSNKDIINYYVKICDGILFPGGPDIHPLYYNEEPRKNLGKVYTDLDEFQIALMKEVLSKNKPILGICRGFQLMNVVMGGTLTQDLSEKNIYVKHYMDCEKHVIAHKVKINSGTFLYDIYGNEMYVNSYHHQIVEKLGKDFEVLALSSDDVIEAIKLKNKDFVVGVQWHPEMMLTASDAMLPVFKYFIEKSMK